MPEIVLPVIKDEVEVIKLLMSPRGLTAKGEPDRRLEGTGLPHQSAGHAYNMREKMAAKRKIMAAKLAVVNELPEKEKAMSEADMEKRARQYAPGVLRVMYDIIIDPKMDPEIRWKTAAVLLERAYGKPLQRTQLTKKKDLPGTQRADGLKPTYLVDVLKAKAALEAAKSPKSA